MVRMNVNTDSGIESDVECENSVILVVDLIGDSVLTSRDDTNDCQRRQLLSPKDESMDVTTTDDKSIEEKKWFSLMTISGETLNISLDELSEYETQCLPEFFSGEVKGKSKESYLKIRNHFINHWFCVKPKRFGYHQILRKVSHLHLGNVTAFSRVQKFLESHKVINNSNLKTNEELLRTFVPNISNGIKREKKSFSENQMKKLGIKETTITTESDDTQSKIRTRPNPFKLVPLETYDNEQEAPFAVRLSMEALAIIDIHSHCVKTEVIGLLGGIYCHQTRQLRIMTSEPCASLDDHDLQCDMEPVSQALAKEALEQKSYHVVGWYHSHPTFVPNPSLRDLETQNNFQQMFSNDSNGQPFVALILSPYCHSNLVSQFKCLFLSNQTFNDYKIPFELNPKIIRTDKMVYHVTNKLQDLCQKVKGHASRVQLDEKVKRFRGKDGMEITHLDKLFYSLKHFLLETGLSSVECHHLLEQCRTILNTHFNS